MKFFMPFKRFRENKVNLKIQMLTCKIFLLKQNVKYEALDELFENKNFVEYNLLELQVIYQAYLKHFQERKNAKVKGN